MTPRHMKSLLRRFAKYVDEFPESPTKCWLWTGGKDTMGYGRLRSDVGTGYKYHRAHRLSYLIYYGGPGKSLVLHSCDNKLCVNPEHLRLGTHSENRLDRSARDPASYNFMRGENNIGSKLTKDNVNYIRTSDKKAGELANELDVTVNTIYRIRNFTTWKEDYDG